MGFNIIEYIDQSWLGEQIWYNLTSKGREVKNISKFLKEQINNPLLDSIIVENNWHLINDQDILIYQITKWVKNNIIYKSDTLNYKQPEYWATVEQILDKMSDDCEGGAYLIVALGRRCGIPKEQLKLACGDVWSPYTKKLGGHAWAIYKSIKFQTVYFFMDWCYYFEYKYPCKTRTSYLFDNELNITPYNNRYKKGWFLVDEEKGMRRMR